jgi:hypothetical protein
VDMNSNEHKPRYASIQEFVDSKDQRVELFHAWAAKARPTLRRMIETGRGIRIDELHRTLDLMVAFTEKDPDATHPSVQHKSHLAGVAKQAQD